MINLFAIDSNISAIGRFYDNSDIDIFYFNRSNALTVTTGYIKYRLIKLCNLPK